LVLFLSMSTLCDSLFSSRLNVQCTIERKREKNESFATHKTFFHMHTRDGFPIGKNISLKFVLLLQLRVILTLMCTYLRNIAFQNSTHSFYCSFGTMTHKRMIRTWNRYVDGTSYPHVVMVY
jgi:hypothetical protein